MRRIVITENHGLWTVETSSGVRHAGASLGSVLDKAMPKKVTNNAVEETTMALDALFATVPPINASNIAEGQAGA